MHNFQKIVAICGLLPSLAFAGWYGGANVGVGQTNQKFTRTLVFDSASGTNNRYQATGRKNESLFYGLFVGKDIVHTAQYRAGLGLEGDLIVHNDILGRTTQDITGAASRLNFNFAASSYLLMARAEAHRKLNDTFGLSGLVNVGMAINELHHFSETVVTAGAVVQRPFRDYSQIQAAFGVGVGFDCQLSKRTELSIGLRYLNSGKGKFRTSADQVNGGRLVTKSLESKLVTLTLRYS